MLMLLNVVVVFLNVVDVLFLCVNFMFFGRFVLMCKGGVWVIVFSSRWVDDVDSNWFCYSLCRKLVVVFGVVVLCGLCI